MSATSTTRESAVPADPWELASIESWADARRRRARAAVALPAPPLERALEVSDRIADLSRAEPARALRVAAGFVEMARSTGERPVAAVARRCRGHVHRRLGQFREALRDYDAARRELAALGYRVEAARTDIGAVDALGHLGRDADARRMARRARSVLARAREVGRVARLDVNLALLEEKAGRPREALASYRRAETIFERQNARMDLALTQFNHANALVALDRYQEALALYRSSAEVWKERGATTTLCRCHLAAGSMLFRIGRIDEALALFEEAREGAATLGDRELEATAALDLARAEILLERFDPVEKRLEEAIRGFDALAMRADQAEALGLRGMARLRTGHLEEALADWEHASRIYRALQNGRGKAWADFGRASVLARAGRAAESRALLRRALPALRAAGSIVWEAEARLLLAEQEPDRRTREAARQLARVARLERSLGDPWIAYRSALARSRLALRGGAGRESRRDLERAYAMARRLQSVLPLEALRAHWSARRSDLYDLALDRDAVPSGTAGPRWLLTWSERARAPRARTLHAEAPRAAGADPDRAAFEAVREELHWLDAGERARRFAASAPAPGKASRVLDRWRRRRAEATSRLERVTQRLELRAAARGRGWLYAEPDPSEIQRALAPDEALVEFLVRDSEIVTLVASRGTIEAVRSEAGLDEARESAHRLRQLWNRHRLGARFSGRHDDALAATAFHLLGRLRELLLAPALSHLPAETRRLLICPHGWLRTVPFHALADEWDVRYTLSGQWLAECPPAGRALGAGLIVGFASPDAPGSELEARAIAGLRGDGALLVGEEATPAAVGAGWPDARLIHVAAHGGIHADDPRLSGLLLAGGTWSVHEIREVDTRADLVILSSCQSGETAGSGDHHVGLLPALFESGARAAVVSLWPADDATTRVLMSSFHHELNAGKTIGEALRAARNVVRTVKPSPYYWAPFVHYGADRRGEIA